MPTRRTMELIVITVLALKPVESLASCGRPRLSAPPSQGWHIPPPKFSTWSRPDRTSMTQMTQGVAAGRPQPQTTVESAGGPFIRHSQPGRRAMYSASGVAFGGLVANPLVAAPGYTRAFRLKIAASGGNGTTAATADFPGNLCSLVQLKDSFGTPLIVAPGYEALLLLQEFGGQYGLDSQANPLNVGGTWATVGTTAANFVFS